MKTITIEGTLRTEFGKSATRQLRSEDKVPAVIYGGAKEINFSAPTAAFRDVVYTPDFLLAEIKVDGGSYKCVLKDLQFDKVTDKLLHIDFVELVPGKKVTVDIPLDYTGTPVGVKEGGRLITELKTLRVKATPENLKSHIELDLSGLHIHDKIRVQDVKAEGMEILNSPRIPVASVTTTRQLKVEETKDATAAATATPAAAGAAPAKEGDAATGAKAASAGTAAKAPAATKK